MHRTEQFSAQYDWSTVYERRADHRILYGPNPYPTRITSFPNPMCINNFFKKINPTRDRPDEIRPESDPTGPVNGIDVCTACSPASVRKNPGVLLLTDLAAAPLLSFSLFTYLLAYYFISLPAWWIHVISEFGFQLWPVDLKYKHDSYIKITSIA